MMRAARFRLALGAFAFFCSGQPEPTRAHEDQPGKPIGEYRVKLSNVKVFDEKGPKDTHGLDPSGEPELLIHTFTEADTHTPGVHFFRNFGSQELPATLDLGELIYFHLDCVPSENLRMRIEVVDEDNGLGPLISKLIELGKKVVPPTEPELRKALDIAGGLYDVFAEELKDAGESYSFEAPGGFVHPDHFPATTVTVNADTPGATIKTSPPAPEDFKGEKLFEFTWSAEYIELPDTVCSTANITQRYKDVSKAETDAAKAIGEILRDKELSNTDNKQSNAFDLKNSDIPKALDGLKQVLDLLNAVSPTEISPERWTDLQGRLAQKAPQAALQIAQHKIALGESLGINMGLARQAVFEGQFLLNNPHPPEENLLAAVDRFQDAWLLALNAPRWPGDASGDGNVDLADFGLLKQAFGTDQPVADFDGDGRVGLGDFGILKVRFGTHPTPEPATGLLAALGILGVAAATRLRRSRRPARRRAFRQPMTTTGSP